MSRGEAFAQAIVAGTQPEIFDQCDQCEAGGMLLPAEWDCACAGKAGILTAEVQTPSDPTYRVYDFKRIDATTGKPRALHIEQAMECIDFSGKPEAEQAAKTRLLRILRRLQEWRRAIILGLIGFDLVRRWSENLLAGEPVVWMMLEGEAQVKVDGVGEATRFGRGETILLPAGMKNAVLKTMGECEWLEVTFPIHK